MKKSIITTILTILVTNFQLVYGSDTKSVYVDLSTQYQSQYIFRGEKVANDVVSGEVSVDYKGVYFGAKYFTDVTTNKSFRDEVNLYTGVKFVNDAITPVIFDIGVTAYMYPNAKTSLRETKRTYEPYVGVTLRDAWLTPSVYAYYDIDKEALTVEGSLHHTFNAPVVTNLYLTPVVTVGYTDIKDVTPKSVKVAESYYYVEAGVEASYALTDFASVMVMPVYNFTENTSHNLNNVSVRAAVNIFF